MQASFEEPELFQARYQRNNKRGGLKNLRCFPTCAAMHRERGFCGRMVVLSIHHEPSVKLAVFAEFVPVLDKTPGLKLEDMVTMEKAKEICRDKANPTKPWIEGEIIEETPTTTRVAFNRDKKGWHYGWASNKHTCNASHTLQAYVMEMREEDKLVVKGVFQSPHFTLFCRRRRRFAMVPSAPIAPPASKKRGAAAKGNEARKRSQDEEEDEDDDDDEGSEDVSDGDDDEGDVTAAAKKEPSLSPGDIGKPQKKRLKKEDMSFPPPPPPPLKASAKGQKRKAQPTAAGKSKKATLVQSSSLMPDTSLSLSAVCSKKATIARVEKMLRELSKRTTARSKPVVLSRPCSPAELFSSTDSASTTTNEDCLGRKSNISTARMTQEQFSAHLFECIDFFGGDSLLDDHMFEGDDDFLDLGRIEDAVGARSQEEKNKVVDDLADYLLDEPTFADAIYALSKASKCSSVDEPQDQAKFDSFIDMLSQHLTAFLRSRLMTEEDFDRMFPDEPEEPFESGAELIARSAFRQVMTAEDEESTVAASLSSSMPKSMPVHETAAVQRLVGSWILAPNSVPLSPSPLPVSSTVPSSSSSAAAPVEYDGLESIRESLGYPWILRKMLNFMEEKFSVSFDGDVLSVRLQRKLFSSGAMTIVLDNQEHDWGMKLPMFEGIAKMWKYRAWVQDGQVHHVHDSGGGVHSRTSRIMWVDDEDCLRIDVSLEEFNQDAGKWETVAHALQRAVRC